MSKSYEVFHHGNFLQGYLLSLSISNAFITFLYGFILLPIEKRASKRLLSAVCIFLTQPRIE